MTHFRSRPVRTPAATLAASLAACGALAGALPPATAPSHHITLRLEPAEGRLEGVDHMALPPGRRGPLALQLMQGLQVQSVSAAGRALPFTREGDALRLATPAGASSLEVRWSGRLAGQAPPRVAAEGTWLPGEAAWYPRLGEADRVRVDVLTPPGQQAALTGALREEDSTPAGTRTVFEAYAGEPPTLLAGPWQCEGRPHRGLRLRACFHAEVAPLSQAYLDDAARHLDRYAAQLGPYAYAGFDMLSGPDPVGLGYPGLTYVSRAILPLPFMRARSLPHEVLHGWWGNGVRVRAGSGNWAEALTTYQSDYALSGAEAQERMRREWLQDFAALAPAADTPLSAFVTKTHARDQVVGYGKGAFVFHMLERQLGQAAFDAGLKRFYAAHRLGDAGWRELQSAFESAGGQRLDGFFPQWLQRAGAPALALQGVDWREDGVTLRLAQTQQGAPYALRVPVEITTGDGARETHVLALEGARTRADIATRARPVALQVDAHADVFRRLAAGERAATLRDVLLLESARTVLVNAEGDAGAAALALAGQLVAQAGEPVAAGAWERTQPALAVGVGTPAAVAAALGLEPPALPAGEPATVVAWAVAG
ncbi:M1 family metallopeptidase, partial [Azohydromonas lata]|uniref:M1 family metallopeptidase n=1 Tax=Azohydromonas lata TaxID=45677 RepID=UPI00082A8A93